MNRNYNEAECILLLSYLCLSTNGFGKNEASVYSQIINNFINSDNFEIETYFTDFDKVISENSRYSIIQYCAFKIKPAIHKKLIIYVIEGVLSDGRVMQEETELLKEIAEEFNIDSLFYNNVLEVMIEKYM